MLIFSSIEIPDGATLVNERSMYKASKIVRTIQYLLFQNVIRDWNDKIIEKYETHSEDFLEEISKMHINDKILTQ